MFTKDCLKDYSAEDKIKIEKDLEIIEQMAFDRAKPNMDNPPIYLATAGGPGSAKTTTLETFLKTNELKHFVYADPDQVCLKNMIYTYRKSLTNYDFAIASSNHAALKDAYDKWRDASNYICHAILQAAFDKKYSVAHGATSTNPDMASLYQKIKALGYRITLLLCYSQDETREKAIKRREQEQGFVQTDPKEVIRKGSDFPRRFDTYFEYADEILFYWNDELTHGKLPRFCAHFIKNENDPPCFYISKETDWKNFSNKYLQDIQQYGIKSCNSFASLIAKPSKVTKEPMTVSAHVLPAMGLYGTNSNLSSGLNVTDKVANTSSGPKSTL